MGKPKKTVKVIVTFEVGPNVANWLCEKKYPKTTVVAIGRNRYGNTVYDLKVEREEEPTWDEKELRRCIKAFKGERV